jgi:hypothetical protein
LRTLGWALVLRGGGSLRELLEDSRSSLLKCLEHDGSVVLTAEVGGVLVLSDRPQEPILLPKQVLSLACRRWVRLAAFGSSAQSDDESDDCSEEKDNTRG